jgi:hypothetical protein
VNSFCDRRPAARFTRIKQPLADYRMATPGYFNTMGIALRQGRCSTSTTTWMPSAWRW